MRMDFRLFFVFLYLFSLIKVVNTEKTILRPNLYFGTRSPTEDSHLSGIMWFEGSRLNSVRHECKHEDDIKRWGWKEFNPGSYGKQQLVDIHNFVKMDMVYLQQQNDWVLQINGTQIKQGNRPRNISMIVYYGVSGKNGKLQYPSLSRIEKKQGTKEEVQLPFFSEDIGNGVLHIDNPSSNISPSNLNTPFSTLHLKQVQEDSFLSNTFWYGKNLHSVDGWTFPSKIRYELEKGMQTVYSSWQKQLASYQTNHPGENLPSITRQQLAQPFQPLLPNTIERNSNFIAVQFVFTLPFSITIHLSMLPSEQNNESLWNSVKQSFFSKSNYPLSSSFFDSLTNEQQSQYIQQQSTQFNEYFSQAFKIDSFSLKYQTAAKAAVSNLIGSISFFIGDTIQKTQDNSLIHTPKGTLYTAIPGRSFFPRGFIWDEGFHQLVISEWNQSLSMEIVRSWMNRIEPSGYLEREQILGDEARSRVPEQFIPQDPLIVNPPTFIFVIEKIAKQYHSHTLSIEVDEVGETVAASSINTSTDSSSMNTSTATSQEQQFLEEVLPKFVQWIDYIERTQKSDLESGYKWYGRTEKHCLASGLDDTPRHSIVSSKESQVDLVSWLAYTYHSISILEKQLHGETSLYQRCSKLSEKLRKEIIEKYWDEEKHCFGDLGLVKKMEGKVEVGFETHPSYISILPFILMLLDENDPKISIILDLIEDPNKLWSDYGIRSLSKADEYFGTEENYWRGKVWINMNYLLLKALYTKYNRAGFEQIRCQSIYSRLRENLINNVVKEYYSSGFFWENYDSETGKGTGVHPFTGWTTLFVLIMEEQYE